MNVKQTGGNHYEKMPYQPIDFILDIGADFPTGNVIKYISRYRDKNGAEDLQKAIDNVSFMQNYEGYQMRLNAGWEQKTRQFLEENNMSHLQMNVLKNLFHGKFDTAKEWIEILMRKEYHK